MKQSISLVTLGVADYVRAKAFYEALSWTVAYDVEETAFFKANGIAGLPSPAGASTARGAGPGRSSD